MADVINSASMLLPIPIVGTEPGPQYATDINSCLTIIDGHNHTPGLGVQVPTAGLNINADLSFGAFNAYNLRSVRFSPQVSPLALSDDLGCLYESGVDLYFNDGLGNQIRITQSGGIAGTPGSIANLTPPASASYVSLSSTFVWQSAANTPANMDAASYIFRNLTANSKGLTLSPPAAMGADYSITLPALPSSQKFLSMDATGTMAASWAVDASTIVISSNLLSVNSTNIADNISIAATGNLLGVKNTMFEHDFELNGNYESLSLPSNQLDGLRFFNFNATIVNAWAWIRSAGSSGTTTLDIKIATAPGGSFTSIFSTPFSFASTAGSAAYADANGVVTPGTGVTAAVLSTTSIDAGTAMRFDLTAAMAGDPDSCGITIVYKQR